MRGLLALLLLACGAAPAPRKGGPEPARLPPAPRDAIWADGIGASAREAVLDGRRAVSERFAARMTSEVEARASEADGHVERVARQRVRTESDFGHVELIETLGVVPDGEVFVARVALDRRRAAEVFRADLEAARERARKLRPVLEDALQDLNTAVLLSTEHSPGAQIAAQSRIARRLDVVEDPVQVVADPEDVRLERAASTLRRRAVLRLEVVGRVAQPVRQAAASPHPTTPCSRGFRSPTCGSA